MATLQQRRWTIAEQAQQLLGGLWMSIAGDCRNARTQAYHAANDRGRSVAGPDDWRPYMSLMSLLGDKELLVLIEAIGTDDRETLRRVIASAIATDVRAMLPLGVEGIDVRLCNGPTCNHAEGDDSHTLRVYYGPQG